MGQPISSRVRVLSSAPVILIVPYKPSWPDEFRSIGAAVRAALGDVALAVHHIGSTSVPGLAAKDVIDVQVTVADLNAPLQRPLERAGFTCRDAIRRDHAPPGTALLPEELEKRYFQQLERPVHLHVHAIGRFNQRYALLCRDFLRAQPLAKDAYAEVKRQGNSRATSRTTPRRTTTSKTLCSTCSWPGRLSGQRIGSCRPRTPSTNA